MPAPRHVVLPQGLGATMAKPEHQDAWHQYEGLIFFLAAIHVAAFAFWCWLLASSRKAKAAEGVTPSASSAALAAGRTTRDVLRAYHKSSLGKG
ncbi:hypothetical protein Rsub_07819 [Raphidocelis subcapitata]|uniref:Uncharacterized protein n=1 Tax=Raphidocelis subcapitata TaxID=307507 RepID=A0A2V0P7D6_9CHLO|nr:hypothetical protein Rsub_07819 [Raphidocelis subcapitata]|eukprot:GBF95469.1 hypothetical protein Rsub_07819 [Raphidocelis subcapitata]